MKSPAYLWLHGLLAQVIEGASDAFLALMGGTQATQLVTDKAATMTPKELLLSMAILSGIYAASYLKKNPLPPAAPKSDVGGSALSSQLPIPPVS